MAVLPKKIISLDYSDSDTESVEESYQNSSSVGKVIWVEQQIKALEDRNRNKEFCKICNVELKSTIHAKTHYVSGKHLQNIQLLREKLLYLQTKTFQDNTESTRSNLQASTVSKEEFSFCKICNVKLMGKSVADTHFNSENHIKYVEAFCYICQLKTTSKEDLEDHKYFSALHRYKLSQLGVYKHKEDGILIPRVFSPKISPKKSPNVALQQIEIQMNETSNCDICHKVFVTELSFTDHKASFSHLALEKLKIDFKPEIIDSFLALTEDNNISCSVCTITMKNLNDVKSHLNSIKHTKKFNKAYETILPQVKYIDAKEEIKETVTISSCYCYICKKEFNSKPEINLHTLSFPHVALAKLKSETVSLGVPYAEYWTQSDNYYFCTLCDAQVFDTTSSQQHCDDPKHRERLIQWSKEFSTWQCGPVVDPKYFYCKTCDVPLIGTSEAELHYKIKSHLRMVELYCSICNIPNSTDEMLQQHNNSFAHWKILSMENRKLLCGNERHVEEQAVDTVSSQTNEDKAMKSPKNENNNNTNISLEQQVCRELNKLIKRLYYSKAIPFNRSLEFLKKVNKEIKELEQKYGKVPDSSDKYFDGNLEYQSSNGPLDTKHFRIVTDKTVSTDGDNNDINSPHSSNSILSIPKEVDGIISKRKRKKKKTLPPIEVCGPDKGEDISVENKPSRFVTENKNVQNLNKRDDGKTSNNENNLVVKCDYTTNFEDMLSLISLSRNETEKTIGKGSVEVEVLEEIETFVKLVDSSDLPLDFMLNFLQNCNKKLDNIIEESEKTDLFSKK